MPRKSNGPKKSRSPKVRALSVEAYPTVTKLTYDFAKYVLCGWAGPEIAKEAFDLIGRDLPKFQIINPVGDYKGKRQMLWEFTRKAIGTDTQNYAQEVGDCVSFSGKNVLEYLQCVEIALNGDAEKFRSIFPPYFYGTSRVFVGGGRIWGDGSTGTWLQEAIKKYGVLAADAEGVPKYSGGVARQWGGGNGPPKQFVEEGKKHLVQTVAQITSAEDCANALLSGYPVSVCSNWGYNMRPSSDGFHAPRGTWNHAMTIIGFDDSDSSKGLYFLILNSWGDVHGQMKDFVTGADLPVGVLRVRGEYVDKMLSQEDSFAYSQFEGFPDNSKKLEKALFDLVGD